jgi:GTP-binding nuclear protein Ran
VGKSTFVNKLLTRSFEEKYVATHGVNVSSLVINTNHGNIKLSLWDTAGQEKFGGLREGYYIGANGAIIMFEVNSIQTYSSKAKWLKDIMRITD